MGEHWFKEAVIYCLQVETFQDSNGDGVGDLPGLISRLDYLERLGVTCLWLNPIHPSPMRDDGYDVADYYGVDPRLGSLGDFAELLHQADNRGLRVMIDLVVNHTSDQHPWFRSACESRNSPYRDWYVWSDVEPPGRTDGVVFPGVQEETWTYQERAGAWYHHRFYDFEPDLNWANPAVRAEVGKIIAFWLRLGVSGFRMDAAPFVIEDVHADTTTPRREFGWLDDLRAHVSWRRGDAVVLAEANVPRDEIMKYFDDGTRLHMLFNFSLNQRLFLALARSDAHPAREALAALPTVPSNCTWATFLRNHDEVDLSELSERERAECFAAFGPEPDMQLYERGIRRRLAPMLGGDQRRIRLAYATQFSMPGTPVLRYGEEIGMGDDLSLPERNALRTPMQWSPQPNAGFSHAEPEDLIRPVVASGDFGYGKVSVDAQRTERDSLLAWFERMLRTLRECPEFGTGHGTLLDSGHPAVLAVRYTAPTGCVITLSNFADADATVDLAAELPEGTELLQMFADDHYDPDPDPSKLPLNGWGYRWLRERTNPPAGRNTPKNDRDEKTDKKTAKS